MKMQFLLLALLAFVLFSCDREDEIPSIYLEGAYENELPSDENAPIYSRVMTFQKSGNILIENFLTPVDSQERCLIGYSEGTYSLRGEEFILTLTSSFGLDPSIEFAIGCIPKEQFVNSFDTDYSRQEGTLVLDNSTDSFVLGYPCNDMIGYMSMCLGPQTYTKVE